MTRATVPMGLCVMIYMGNDMSRILRPGRWIAGRFVKQRCLGGSLFIDEDKQAKIGYSYPDTYEGNVRACIVFLLLGQDNSKY